ncbi:patatin-domain-containing protein [Rickenella mellea]|uniref:Patatin-like phospholipase domain-containing protein n=1 Tax=Rickenella mellea TaxID=50990 RepID=A0A4R5XF06_9AGAM|nr:patatin-domain-containing protein [Rickenella mellea]
MPLPQDCTLSLEDELTADYVDERHIQAFAHALTSEDLTDIDTPDVLSPDPNGHSQPMSNGLHSPRIRKVSALSDFAPVHVKVKKRRKGTKSHEKRQEWLFLLVRWPLLIFIFLFIAFEFSLYIVIRQCVNAKEWFTAWRGRKGYLRKRLRAARTYDEWKAAGATLDEYLKFDEWKTVDDDRFYDWRLVRKVLGSLRRLREKDDVRGVLGVLETCIRSNFAGVESSRKTLIDITQTYLGTKNLIESYITEVQQALIYIRESSVLSVEEKRRFFKSANTNLGISALCLSGGATFGYYHFGVLKAFVQARLLPRVITGTSAGALVAALACTRTDAELETLLVPELANNITACEEPFRVWFKRFWTTGARFDSLTWARKANFFTRGSLTFKEAYMRTGRILNVSVIPADRHSPTKLLNYMNAPDTVIWSAIIASAAVPGILQPVVLMQKIKDGSIVPWNWGSKFKDGSLRVDIPIRELNMYFNVTYPVVSQVNPHVHLFFFAPRGSAGKPVAHRKGKGWRGNFLLSAAEQWLKLELTKNFKFIRDLDLLPQLLGQDWSSVFLQRFEGTVTIWPKTRFMDWVRILSDPDVKELERMMLVGQSVTWPKLHIIENRYRLEKEIFRGRQMVRRTLHSLERTPLPAGGLSSQDQGDRQDSAPGSLPVPADTTVSMLSDAPLPVDTDDEPAASNAYVMRLRRMQTMPALSGTSTPSHLQASLDPLRSPARRRKWATQLLSDHEAGTSKSRKRSRSRTPDPGPPHETANPLPPPRGLLARLRSTSFPRLISPFSTIRKTDKRPDTDSFTNHAWSSDSSEDDIPLHTNTSFSPQTATFGQRLGERQSYFDEEEQNNGWGSQEEDNSAPDIP